MQDPHGLNGTAGMLSVIHCRLQRVSMYAVKAAEVLSILRSHDSCWASRCSTKPSNNTSPALGGV